MNIANFNLGLLDSDLHESVNGRAVLVVSRDILTSPLFLSDDREDSVLVSKENEDVGWLLAEPNALPFKTFRLFLRANSTDRNRDGTAGFSFWCQHKDGVLISFVQFHGPSGAQRNEILRLNSRSPSEIEFNMRVGNRWMNNSERLRAPILRDQAKAVWTSLCWFIRDVTSPANHIAAVYPKKQGKSVQWLNSRLHYVLLHRSHPANSATVAEGQVVATDDHYLKRTAHTRRAHARVLRSPRFKNKIGQTIFIRSCWVGPKEWEQSGSIYKLVSPVAA